MAAERKIVEKPTGKRVLVTGGRDFTTRAFLDAALDRYRQEHGVALIIHGGARGADALAGRWAQASGVPFVVMPAHWQAAALGKAAGPIRNQWMLDLLHPDVVIAFPGGVGTRDMVARARRAGVDVWCPVWLDKRSGKELQFH